MKHLFIISLFSLFGYTGFSQSSVTVYNNSCSDKEVHVHWHDPSGSCGSRYQCSTYYMDAKVVSASSNATFSVPCGSAIVYRVEAYILPGGSSSNLYLYRCGTNTIGNEECDQFQVHGSGSHFEVNPY